MTKKRLLVAIGAAVLAVAALAVLAPTVIVRGDGDREVRVQIAAQPGSTPSAPFPNVVPGIPNGLPGLQNGVPGKSGMLDCLRKQGLAPNRQTPPSLQGLRDALKACLGRLPGRP